MNVVVAGANGTTGRQIVALLARHGHNVRALIRKPEQAPLLQAMGAETVLGDLEEDVAHAVEGMEAAVFAAGSGGHTPPQKTWDVDRDGAIRYIDACKEHGVGRFVMLSSMRAGDPESGREKIRHYLQAKHEADEHLKESGLTYTVVRPGSLTNETGTGRIRLSEGRLKDREGAIPRADVAHIIVECFEVENTAGRVFEVLSGETPIAEALRSL